MDQNRFIPRLEEIEARETPAAGLTPDQVFAAEALANFYYDGTAAALTDQSFISQSANRSGTQSLAAVIVGQVPALQDTLSAYVVELQQEKAAAAPAAAGWYDGLIDRFAEAANHARLAAAQAQAVSAAIDNFNAADAARASGSSATSTGTTSTGVTGINPLGVSTGTNNTLPTTGSGTGTTGSSTTTTTPPTDTGTSTTGTPTGSTTTGDGSTTGSSGTGTTPTQTSGLSSGTPGAATG